MEYITEQNTIPIYDECDVLVAGGGIAGISAALAAARQGARVTLLEREYMLGGLGTAGLIAIYLPICDGMGNQVSFGIAEELLKLSIKHGFARRNPDVWLRNATKEERANGNRYMVEYNPHMFAISAEKLLLKEGVKILYGTSAAAVHMNGEKINAVITENKSGRRAIRVKSVVDCTGDADICVLSGAGVELYHQKNVLASWYYFCDKNGVNLKLLGYADIPEDEKEGKETELLIDERFLGTDAEEISRFVQLGHDKIQEDVLEQNKDAQNIEPVTIPSIPQLRMTRMIKGIYPASKDDDHKDINDSVGVFSNWKVKGPAYQLSFRSLYGKDVKNLIVAGRCIYSTQSMWDVTRVIPVCAVSGEAAGTAAAMSDDFSLLDVKSLQEKLIEKGVKITF